MIDVTFYVQLKPVVEYRDWERPSRRWLVKSVQVVNTTLRPPKSAHPNTVLVEVTLSIPEDYFVPVTAKATVPSRELKEKAAEMIADLFEPEGMDEMEVAE